MLNKLFAFCMICSQMLHNHFNITIIKACILKIIKMFSFLQMAGTIDMTLQSDIMTMFENNFD